MEQPSTPPPLQRYLVTVAYDGRHFHGSQSLGEASSSSSSSALPLLQTVEGAMREALHKIISQQNKNNKQKKKKKKRFLDDDDDDIESNTDEDICGRSCCVLSGRTDAGVHAHAMALHLDFPQRLDPGALVKALNANIRWVVTDKSSLPSSNYSPCLSVRSARFVPSSFHSRVSAALRRYTYIVVFGCQAEDVNSPHHASRAWLLEKSLGRQEERLRECVEAFRGTHNFRNFCTGGSGGDRSSSSLSSSSTSSSSYFTRTIEEASVIVHERGYDFPPVGTHVVEIHFASLSFLYHQVRAMVAAAVTATSVNEITMRLLRTNQEKEEEQEADKARSTTTTRTRMTLAPPGGLYFMGVEYPDAAFTPIEAEGVIFRPPAGPTAI